MSSWYLLSENDQMLMVWEAELPTNEKQVDVKTPINMCNHTYWNLSGNFKQKNVKAHRLELNCDNIVDMDEDLIPTGKLEPVDDSPFDMRRGDFKRRVPFLTGMDRLDGAIDAGGEPGLDHQFVINIDEG